MYKFLIKHSPDGHSQHFERFIHEKEMIGFEKSLVEEGYEKESLKSPSDRFEAKTYRCYGWEIPCG